MFLALNLLSTRRQMMEKMNINGTRTRRRGRGMTPSEVMVYNLCESPREIEEIFFEISSELELKERRSHDEFEACLKALKKRNLLLY